MPRRHAGPLSSRDPVRNLPQASPEDLARADVDALIAAALDRIGVSMTAPGGGEVVIKSVSAKQRSRRQT